MFACVLLGRKLVFRYSFILQFVPSHTFPLVDRFHRFPSCFPLTTRRMAWSRSQGGGAETTVVTAFYSLILATSALRAIWFLIPSSWMVPSYVPSAVMAFDPNDRSWIGAFISQILQSAGSLCLFGIFILILVYWADILKKYFYPGARRSRPMSTFLILVSSYGRAIWLRCADSNITRLISFVWLWQVTV